MRAQNTTPAALAALLTRAQAAIVGTPDGAALYRDLETAIGQLRTPKPVKRAAAAAEVTDAPPDGATDAERFAWYARTAARLDLLFYLEYARRHRREYSPDTLAIVDEMRNLHTELFTTADAGSPAANKRRAWALIQAFKASINGWDGRPIVRDETAFWAAVADVRARVIQDVKLSKCGAKPMTDDEAADWLRENCSGNWPPEGYRIGSAGLPPTPDGPTDAPALRAPDVSTTFAVDAANVIPDTPIGASAALEVDAGGLTTDDRDNLADPPHDDDVYDPYADAEEAIRRVDERWQADEDPIDDETGQRMM